jgi:hypothetical protein
LRSRGSVQFLFQNFQERQEVRKILISAAGVKADAELADNKTADAIWKSLPIEGRVNRWGEEIYFSISVSLEEEPDARDVMDMGEIGYWPPGRAFCIFFGPTPASRGGEIRAASKVNVFGKISGDAKLFGKVSDGTKITIKGEAHGQ